MKIYRFALGIRVRRLASCVDASIKSIVACMLTKFFARHARNQLKIVPILCKNLPLGGFAALFILITHGKQRFFASWATKQKSCIFLFLRYFAIWNGNIRRNITFYYRHMAKFWDCGLWFRKQCRIAVFRFQISGLIFQMSAHPRTPFSRDYYIKKTNVFETTFLAQLNSQHLRTFLVFYDKKSKIKPFC